MPWSWLFNRFWGTFIRNDAMTLRDRVERSLKFEIAPTLSLDGSGIEVVEVENGIASVRLSGVCAGCPATIVSLISSLEIELRKQIPEVEILEAVL